MSVSSTSKRSRAEALDAVSGAFKGAIAAMRRLRSRDPRNPGELSYAQYGLLFGLHRGEAMSLRELALTADVSPAAATEMLDGLVASGLVERVRSAEDKRIVLSSLTDRGRTLVEERRALYEPRWRAALSRFSDAELQSAVAVLETLRELFDELAESEH